MSEREKEREEERFSCPTFDKSIKKARNVKLKLINKKPFTSMVFPIFKMA